MNNYDLFWTAFAAIGQAVGAIATSAAVIVTLWQIRYANRKKVKMRFSDKNVVISENGNLEFHFVNLTVTNIGNRNIIVRNWGIKVSKKQNLLIVPDMTNPIVKAIQKQLPCTLEPEESLDLVFDIKLFLRNLREQLKNGTFKEKDKLTLYMLDSTGKEYCIRSDKTIKKYIEDNQKYE
ncbi:MAG: hypothetical protein SO170_06155 [Butyribacter sp.]|nr:hypothetical protein [bacterium]MDY3854515.1 hypothetical protein [Butyribacter sp.]